MWRKFFQTECRQCKSPDWPWNMYWVYYCDRCFRRHLNANFRIGAPSTPKEAKVYNISEDTIIGAISARINEPNHKIREAYNRLTEMGLTLETAIAVATDDLASVIQSELTRLSYTKAAVAALKRYALTEPAQRPRDAEKLGRSDLDLVYNTTLKVTPFVPYGFEAVRSVLIDMRSRGYPEKVFHDTHKMANIVSVILSTGGQVPSYKPELPPLDIATMQVLDSFAREAGGSFNHPATFRRIRRLLEAGMPEEQVLALLLLFHRGLA